MLSFIKNVCLIYTKLVEEELKKEDDGKKLDRCKQLLQMYSKFDLTQQKQLEDTLDKLNNFIKNN